MKHLQPLNRAAERLEAKSDDGAQVEAMMPFPIGCTTALDPGVEVDAAGGVSTLCVPWEADLYGCAEPCYWPAQIPDVNTHPDWTDGKRSGISDWRELEQIYPKE